MRGYIPGSSGSSGKDGQEGKTHETEIWVVPSDWHILCSYLPLAGGGGGCSLPGMHLQAPGKHLPECHSEYLFRRPWVA